MTKPLVLAALAAVAAVQVSCTGPNRTDDGSNPERDPPLQAPNVPDEAEERPSILGQWRVVAIEAVDGSGIRLSPPTRGAVVTIDFSKDSTGGRVSGFSGVNSFGAACTFSLGERSVGSLTVRDIAATMRAGPEDAMDFERSFLAALRSSRTITFIGRDAVIDTGSYQILLSR
jgi:heat shock protein HslJ